MKRNKIKNNLAAAPLQHAASIVDAFRIDEELTRFESIIIFLATGALSHDRVISRHHSVIWFLGWRCLYAEIVNSRVESRTIDLDKALKRAVSMLIGRLRAYGLRWKVWAQASRYRSQRNKIGKKHRNKKLLFQTEDGNYIIHDAILGMATYLRLM